MKTHLYELSRWGSSLLGAEPFFLQTRLYIPEFKGVLIFSEREEEYWELTEQEKKGISRQKKEEQVLEYSTDRHDVEQAIRCISGEKKIGKYIGVVELPDNIVSKVVSDAESLNQARNRFFESAKTLADLI